MRRISSKATFIHKRLFPVFWFGFLGIWTATAAGAMSANKHAEPMFVIVPAAMAVFGYFIMKQLVFDLVDEVWDAGDELLIRNGGTEERVPLANIINVSFSSFTNPARVTLTLREPGRFGKEIAFSPPGRFLPFGKHPMVAELIERIDEKRRRR